VGAGIAAIKHETQSSRNQTVVQGIAVREVGIMTAPGTGSTMALDELQKEYSSRLFKTILRITKNWEDAEDALQDTFLRAYLALHGFGGRSSVYSWLTRIAINSALMVLRRSRSRPEAFLIYSFEEGDAFSSGAQGFIFESGASVRPSPEKGSHATGYSQP
jgi:hypothetical protein